MIDSKNSPGSSPLTDKFADSAQHALSAAQSTANNALDGLSGNVQEMRNYAGPLIANAQSHAHDLLQSGRDSVRNASHQLTDAARHARDGTVSYVKEEPVKSMLIAAATGAALMALVGMMSRSGGRS